MRTCPPVPGKERPALLFCDSSIHIARANAMNKFCFMCPSELPNSSPKICLQRFSVNVGLLKTSHVLIVNLGFKAIYFKRGTMASLIIKGLMLKSLTGVFPCLQIFKWSGWKCMCWVGRQVLSIMQVTLSRNSYPCLETYFRPMK